MMSLSELDPRRILRVPRIYGLLQRTVGAPKGFPQLIAFISPKAGDRVLDAGCGTAEILQHLPPTVEYHGFDLNPTYVAAAAARYGTRGNFWVRAVTPDAADGLGLFDTVIAIGVLHHLTDTEADALFIMANKVLRPGGRVLTCDGTFVPGQSLLTRLLLGLDRGQHIRTPEAYVALAHRSFPNAKAHILHNLISLPYTHCIIEAARTDNERFICI